MLTIKKEGIQSLTIYNKHKDIPSVRKIDVAFSHYLFMKDKLSLSDRTSFSRFSHRFKTDCISDGIAGVKFLSFASAILQQEI